MNRWFSTSTRRHVLQIWGFATLASAAGLAVTSAQAQMAVRKFPDAARRGYLEVKAPPQVLINGEATQLSPGSRILGPNNQMMMSGQLIGQAVVVNYLRNPSGQIHDVWVLSAAEIKADRKDRPGSEPRLNFRFGSDTPSANGNVPYDQQPKFKN